MTETRTLSEQTTDVVDDAFESLLVYECMILYSTNFSTVQEQHLFEEIERIFSEAQGTQLAKDNWGRRGLAYQIAGHREGNFVVYHIKIPPKNLRDVDRELRIVPGVLRHIIVKPPQRYQIVRFSEKYQVWLKERESAGQLAARMREESLRRKVVERATRRARQEEKKEQKPPTDVLKEKDLEREIEKIISDEDLDL